MRERRRSCLAVVLAFALRSGGAEVPSIIYGTAWKKDQTKALVKQALEEGFRAIDTANMPKHYNESLVGDALQEAFADERLGLRREDLWIQTKFTPDALDGQPVELHPYSTTSDVAMQVRESFASSLTHLGVSYVDSLLLHAPFPEEHATLVAWREMERIHAEGGAKSIGVSNFDAGRLERLLAAASVQPAFVQNRCLLKTGWDQEVRELCARHGIHYQGFWLLTGNRFVTSATPVTQIAGRWQKTPQQVLFRYLTQHLGLIALTGTKNRLHMRQDLEVAHAGFTLTGDELAQIAAVEAPRFTAQDPVTATFHNKLSGEVRLFWQQPDNGELVESAVLAPEGHTNINSYHSHTFLAKLGDQIVLHWKADREKGRSQDVNVDMRLEVEFKNTGESPCRVFWRNLQTGEEVPQGETKAGGSLSLSTFVGHVFVLRDPSGAVVYEWTAEVRSAGTQEVFVRDELREL